MVERNKRRVQLRLDKYIDIDIINMLDRVEANTNAKYDTQVITSLLRQILPYVDVKGKIKVSNLNNTEPQKKKENVIKFTETNTKENTENNQVAKKGNESKTQDKTQKNNDSATNLLKNSPNFRDE